MRCLICQSECSSFMDKGTDSLTHHCSECDLIFKDPSLFQDLPTQKLRYDLHQNSAEDMGYRAYFQKFIDFELSSMGERDYPKSGLDFGSGRSSLLADMMSDIGITTLPYDPVYRADEKLLDARYDIVTSVEVFEHLTDPISSLKQIISMVSSGGLIAIRTEFHHGVDGHAKWYYPKDPTHILFYTPKTFEKLSEIFGCKVVAHNEKNMILLEMI